jgi:hypothetical protein
MRYEKTFRINHYLLNHSIMGGIMNHCHVFSFKKNAGTLRGGILFLDAIVLLLLHCPVILAQIQAYNDNFNRISLASSAPTTYSVTVTAGDGGAGIISSSYLELTNDASGTANGDGIIYVSGLTQDFLGTYNQTLHANTNTLEWTFNFRYNRASNPSGLAASNYGTAFILANSNNVFAGTGAGNGYAVVFGSAGTPDPIRLVKYSGGLNGTITNIISSGTNDISVVNNYVSVRVRYEPGGDTWSLFIRDDGAAAWSDPSAGVTMQKGLTTSDNAYTSVPLTHFGFYWAYATAIAQSSQFDNFNVQLIPSNIPEITLSTSMLPSFGTLLAGSSSISQSFSISGTNLTANMILISPPGFEMRSGTNSYSTNPITLVEMNGTIATTSIDVRFSPTSAATYSGNITCTSTGAVTKTIAVTGIGTSTGLDLFLTDDQMHTDAEHAVFYPHAGIGAGSVYGTDDWTYNSPATIFYVVPSGGQSIGAAAFDITWDPAMANLMVSAGNMFDFFSTENIAPGKIRINTGASSSLNVLPAPGKYLAKLNFIITQPGCNELNVTGADFRTFDGDAQQNLQVTAHSGLIRLYLGDFAAQNNAATGDGKINFDDLSVFAAAYFSESDGDPAGYKTKFDIGPTNSNGNYFLIPNPDGRIQFEDLAIFSLGYGKSAASQLLRHYSNRVTISAIIPSFDAEGILSIPLSISGSITDVHAMSISLSYSASLEYAGYEKSGEMNHEYCFMAAQARNNNVTIDAAIIGLDHQGLSKEGSVANVLFKKKGTSKSYDVTIQSAVARDNRNNDIQVFVQSEQSDFVHHPAAFALNQNYPNPFNLSTMIRYELSSTSYVTLSIYDLLGCEIVKLVNAQQDAGSYQIGWNGRDYSGKTVSSGVYVYRLTAVDRSQIQGTHFVCNKKMVLAK